MITISITQADIEEGKPYNCQYCPVALAVSRAFGCAQNAVSVDGVFLSVGEQDYRTPALVNEFIQAFDDGAKVIPFTFTLDT